MLSVEEFNQATGRFNRTLILFGGIAIAGLFTLWGMLGFVRHWWMLEIELRLGETGAELAFVVTLAASFLTFLVVLMVIITRASKDQRLHCPYCHRMLAERCHLVVRTHNREYCGRRVLLDPDSG